jgi:hypothetical protein
MARYEIVFVIEAPDELAHEPKDVVNLPWWPFIGEDPMSPEWLEYILVRELLEDENTFDFLDSEGINVIFEDREEELAYERAKASQTVETKREIPEWLKLVVDNDEEDKTKTDTETQQRDDTSNKE